MQIRTQCGRHTTDECTVRIVQGTGGIGDVTMPLVHRVLGAEYDRPQGHQPAPVHLPLR